MIRSKSRKKNDEAILDVEEYGILSMTCSSLIPESQMQTKNVIYTSKESYLWVPIIAYLVRETDIKHTDIKVFLELSLDAITSHQRAKWSNRAEGLAIILELINSMLFYCTRQKFNNPIFYDPIKFGELIEDIIERLERLGLIEEQFNQPESNNYFSVLGFVPVGFTSRTKLGESLLSKLDSMMMFYANKNIVKDSDFDIHYKYYTTWKSFMHIINTFEVSKYKKIVKDKKKKTK
jgi:hypothetical protein